VGSAAEGKRKRGKEEKRKRGKEEKGKRKKERGKRKEERILSVKLVSVNAGHLIQLSPFWEREGGKGRGKERRG
jgi:hypothetical protein